jgi:hypothetical protein
MGGANIAPALRVQIQRKTGPMALEQSADIARRRSQVAGTHELVVSAYFRLDRRFNHFVRPLAALAGARLQDKR